MSEILWLFLRLGVTGFGGPIALVALIEQAVCKERKWLTEAEFSEIFSICKLLPGPLAVQVAIYTGYRRLGRIGGLVAGTAFIMPSILIMLVLSILYVQNGSVANHKIAYVFRFMQDATIAIIITATWDLAKVYIIPSVTTKSNSRILIYLPIILILIATVIIFFLPTFEPAIIIIFGILGVLFTKPNHKKLPLSVLMAYKPLIPTIFLGSISLAVLGQLLWICIKAGEFSFGTGLAIIPLLHGDLVTNTHWLTNKQFLDGVALGQITPGPTTVSVVFFGYQIAGIMGLIVATLGFYMPAFMNTLILLPLLWNKLTKTIYLQTFLRWAFPAIIGGIASATFRLGYTSMTSWYDLLLMLITLFICLRKFMPVWAIIPLSGIIGLIIGFI